MSHLHNGLSPAYLRLLAQKCVILNTCPELTGVIIGPRLELHDVIIEAQGMYITAQYSAAGHSVLVLQASTILIPLLIYNFSSQD